MDAAMFMFMDGAIPERLVDMPIIP